MTVDVLVFTDGYRPYINQTILSAKAALHGDIGSWWIFEDTTDPAIRASLIDRFATLGVGVVSHPVAGLGYAGAVDAARRWAHEHLLGEHLFWLEDDFVFDHPVDLDAMATVLDAEQPALVQLALLRGPVNSDEQAAGGIVEQHPEAYQDRETAGYPWLSHRVNWTQNPHLVDRGELHRHAWPTGDHSEGRFGIGLRDAGHIFGYWGARADPPHVTHIGDISAIGAQR